MADQMLDAARIVKTEPNAVLSENKRFCFFCCSMRAYVRGLSQAPLNCEVQLSSAEDSPK